MGVWTDYKNDAIPVYTGNYFSRNNPIVSTGPLGYYGSNVSAVSAASAVQSIQRINASVSFNGEVIPFVYGRIRVVGYFAYMKVISTYLHVIWVLCEGEVDSINNILLKSTAIEDVTGITYESYVGTLTQTVCGLNAYDSDFTDPMIGTAYIWARIPSGAFTEMPKCTAVVKGMKCYDPRDTTTVWTNNAALIRANFMTNRRFGERIPTDMIDWDTVDYAADLCDIIQDIENIYTVDLTPTMSADDRPYPWVTSASSGTAWSAFNKAAASWTSTSSTGWLKIKGRSDSKITLGRYTITSPTDQTRAPKDWTVQGSNDDISYDVLDTQTGIVFTTAEKKTFDVTNTTAYQYYKIVITLNNGSSYVSINEMELMEIEPDPMSFAFDKAIVSQTSQEEIGSFINSHFLGNVIFDGLYKIIPNEIKKPVATFSDADIIGGISSSRKMANEKNNRITAKWIEPDDEYWWKNPDKYTEESYTIEASGLKDEGEVLDSNIDLTGCIVENQVKTIAMYTLNSSLACDLSFSFSCFNAKGLELYDVFSLEHDMGLYSEELIENCEDAWNEFVDADVTASLDTVDFKVGSGCAKFVCAAGLAAGDIIATEAIAALDISKLRQIGKWIKSSVTLDAGDLQLLLDNTASCATPIESINIPKINADVWTYVYLPLAAPASCTAIISVGLKMIVDKGAFDLRVDDINAYGILLQTTGITHKSDGSWDIDAVEYNPTAFNPEPLAI